MISENGSIQLLLLQIIPLALAIGFYFLSQQHSLNTKTELETLCYTKFLQAQAKVANSLNWVEKTYNPEAKTLNSSWDANEKALKASVDPRLKAVFLALKAAIEAKQRVLHFEYLRNWNKSLQQRRELIDTVVARWKLQDRVFDVYAYAVPIVLKPKELIHFSPEYNTSSLYLSNLMTQVWVQARLNYLDFSRQLTPNEQSRNSFGDKLRIGSGSGSDVDSSSNFGASSKSSLSWNPRNRAKPGSSYNYSSSSNANSNSHIRISNTLSLLSSMSMGIKCKSELARRSNLWIAKLSRLKLEGVQ